jgi:energy-coupling factor transporter ATP-binding protein EcfA2
MEDAPLFFGRHTHIAEMIALLERQRFLAVVGASGSGKSSLVRAGLLPSIRDGYIAVDSEPENDVWRIAIARPGDDPYRALAESLVAQVLGDSLDGTALQERTTQCEAVLRASQYGLTNAMRDLGVPATDHVVVLVDQFEELFRFRRDEVTRSLAGIRDESTLCERRNDANAFVNLLLKSCQQDEQFVFVILTMRSDFLGDCDAFIGLPEAISRSQYLTPRLTRSQLEEAIRGPLALPQFNATIADNLVTRILNDVGTEADQLPLMQHALMRSWQRAIETQANIAVRELSIEHYEHVGGVRGALDQHANEIFMELGDTTSRQQLQYVAMRLFCSLSDRRDGGPLTRRSITVAKAALEAGATENEIQVVARAFQAANLLVFSPPGQMLGPRTRLDISHESLLRQWKLLQTWIDTEMKSAMSYRRLMDAVRTGETYLSDTHLAQAQEWKEKFRPNKYWAMRYDGGTLLGEGFFEQCCVLMKTSQEARLERLAKEQAAAEREKVLLASRVEAETKRAEAESQRAREAEEASIRYQKRTNTARFALFLAFVFMVAALYKWREANIAAKEALVAANKAEDATKDAKQKAMEALEANQIAVDGLTLQLKMFTEPTALCGRIAGAATANAPHDVNVGIVQRLLEELEFSKRPFANTGAIGKHFASLKEQANHWKDDKSKINALLQSVLRLSRQYRIAWEEQSKGLQPETKKLSWQLLVQPAYNRALDIVDRLTKNPTDPQNIADFESIYWGELVLLEDSQIEGVMVELRRALDGEREGLVRQATKLKDTIEYAFNASTDTVPEWLTQEFKREL